MIEGKPEGGNERDRTVRLVVKKTSDLISNLDGDLSPNGSIIRWDHRLPLVRQCPLARTGIRRIEAATDRWSCLVDRASPVNDQRAKRQALAQRVLGDRCFVLLHSLAEVLN